MSITTTYKCDKCGNQQPTPTQFWTVGIAVQSHELACRYGHHLSIHGNVKIHVCRPCLKSFGIHTKEVPTPNTPETIESLMRKVIELAGSQP